jgi:hypothetical protein
VLLHKNPPKNETAGSAEVLALYVFQINERGFTALCDPAKVLPDVDRMLKNPLLSRYTISPEDFYEFFVAIRGIYN